MDIKIESIDTKNDIKFRDSVYRMVISQLFYDGHSNIAVELSNLIKVSELHLNLTIESV